MSRAEGLRAGMQRAVALGLLLGGDDLVEDLRLALLVALLRPDAAPDQVVLQPQDRIAERPGVGLGLRAVGRRDRPRSSARRRGR